MASKLLSFLEDQIRAQYAHYLAERCAQDEGRKLALVRLKLTELPPALASCTFLSKLSLDGNLLPSESILGLQQLKFLRYLTLNDNKLNQLPEGLCQQLKFVEFLNISGNPMCSLPEQLGQMKNLITLWCNDMRLEQLPEAVGTLHKLRTFGARNNQLSCLPESFGSLRRLRWLTLECNQLTELPESCAQLVNLVHLNLGKNYFRELPEQVYALRRLKYCSFANNPLEELDESTLEELEFIDRLVLGEHSTPRGLQYDFQILEESIPRDWEHSLPNSEINSPDSSDDENMSDAEPPDMHITELVRICCAV